MKPFDFNQRVFYIMKVVCINNVELGRDSYGKPRHNMLPLTIGKVYEVVDEESPMFLA